MIRKIFLVLLVLFLAIQFYPRPAKNTASALSPNDITSKHAVPGNVQALLKESCNDCHSNNTVYPWYSTIQPVAWWLGGHIAEGKRKLNFSEFAGYSLRKQYHKLEEVEEMVAEGEMPLPSYTIVHTSGKLTEEEKKVLIDWSRQARAAMKATYPADSLVSKKQG